MNPRAQAVADWNILTTMYWDGGMREESMNQAVEIACDPHRALTLISVAVGVHSAMTRVAAEATGLDVDEFRRWSALVMAEAFGE